MTIQQHSDDVDRHCNTKPNRYSLNQAWERHQKESQSLIDFMMVALSFSLNKREDDCRASLTL